MLLAPIVSANMNWTNFLVDVGMVPSPSCENGAKVMQGKSLPINNANENRYYLDYGELFELERPLPIPECGETRLNP